MSELDGDIAAAARAAFERLRGDGAVMGWGLRWESLPDVQRARWMGAMVMALAAFHRRELL